MFKNVQIEEFFYSAPKKCPKDKFIIIISTICEVNQLSFLDGTKPTKCQGKHFSRIADLLIPLLRIIGRESSNSAEFIVKFAGGAPSSIRLKLT